jgi:hypothetical protein
MKPSVKRGAVPHYDADYLESSLTDFVKEHGIKKACDALFFTVKK